MADPIPLPTTARRRRLTPLLGAISYVRNNRARCFICGIVAGDPAYAGHHAVYESGTTIAFLAKYATHWGHTLVCPKAHREHAVTDFTADDYAALQLDVHRVASALTRTVPTERLYILTLGSQQLNRHVHWHLAPLPPGVALPRQQFRSFSPYLAGQLDVPDEELGRLAERIRSELGG